MKEIIAHAEAQTTSHLENGKVSQNGVMLSDDEGGSDHPDVKIAVAGYKWSPDDVLCLTCFMDIFKELYYAWWLEERQTDRVEGELIFGVCETVLSDGSQPMCSRKGRVGGEMNAQCRGMMTMPRAGM
jgi:hypothetical protein